jgi:hypothetical protein
MPPQFFFVVVGLCCALLCGHYAARKGRSVALWAALGLVFGIFAVIYANFMSSRVDPA